MSGSYACEAEGVRNRSLFDDFIVADQAGENGQSGGIGRRPSRRTEPVGVQVEDGAAAGCPTSDVAMGMEQLEESPVVAIDNQDMPVALTVGSPFDRCVKRDRVGSRFTLRRVFDKLDRDPGLRTRDDHVREAVGPTTP